MRPYIHTVFVLIIIINGISGKYKPTWDSLDERPLPQWYDEAKLGIFVHWGVYSVPSFGSEWFWKHWKDNETAYVDYMRENYPETWTYQQFAKNFKADLFDSNKWAQIFASSGAKYIVLTSKHHDGYALWPSNYSYSWNSADVGPGIDIVGELGTAVKKQNLKFGVYHSLYEWYNPQYLSDNSSGFATREFVNNKIHPEMKELVVKYQPSILWSDGEWEAPSSYWRSTEFLAWLYNESPVKDEIVTNDRWGSETGCKHGDFYNCHDRYNPGTLQSHKWENAMTIDRKSWGFRRNADLSDYYTIEELLNELVITVSCGGNLLMNVGPTKDGTIDALFQERLYQLGGWLSINGEAIYGTKPWTIQNDTLANGVWYTSKNSTLYAIVLSWPESDNSISLGSAATYFANDITKVTLLGNEEDGTLPWVSADDRVTIRFPEKAVVKSQWAYVLEIVPSQTSTGYSFHKFSGVTVNMILAFVCYNLF